MSAKYLRFPWASVCLRAWQPLFIAFIMTAPVASKAFCSETVDLAVTKVVYDLTENVVAYSGASRRMFCVNARVESLTGRVINNTYLFRVNLYWAKGAGVSDRLGLAATGRFSLSHQNYPAGSTAVLVVPTASTSTTVYRQPAAATFLVAELTEFVGIEEIDASDNLQLKRIVTTAALASRVLSRRSIILANAHASGQSDNAFAISNVRDAAAGRAAKRSSYTDKGVRGPGGQTEVDARMLNGLFFLGLDYSLRISEVAGGVHRHGSLHYKGVTFDVTHINGIRATAAHPLRTQFVARAKSLGAANVGIESDHFHVDWRNDPETAATTSTR